MSTSTLPRISVSRREAAQMLGVSEDTIRRAKDSGALKAKKTSKDGDGNGRGKELYSVKALQDWFDGLADA